MTSTDPLPPLWPDSDPSVLAPVAEHEDLRAVVRGVLTKHADAEQVRAAAESGAGPTEVWRLLTSELDLVAIAVPEDRGGAGFGVRELVVVLEETGAALVVDPVLSSAVLGTRALVLAPADVSGGLLEAALTGEALLTVSLQSPGGLVLGSDGTVDGDLSRVLHGEHATHVVASAAGPDGPVLVAVDIRGAEVRPVQQVDPTRRLVDIGLAAAPATVLVDHRGHADAFGQLASLTALAVAAEHTGMVDRLLDMTVEYVGTRQQFGRPVGSFQAIKHRLADVLVARERCRSAVRYAAASYDLDPRAAAPAAEVAAVVAADAVVTTAHEAIQLHGGIGFTWEHPAHLYLRRALGDEGQFGGARDHRSRLAELLAL
ncbi:acyl-CoA dehydrogenase family protein [Nocardioides zeae]|uniref:Acyl-CoA dehydrogenase family protein n=1 Tax=Nocardioides imazamoxiresistens TaxID=3231893 RepID=A0ABU3PVI9_9ACTN|nr:acyl-CoA dehydrogenase family protein [Nocardioides zeae]MDT9593260.1 acyl-CoA dehydrogenase family protein [Nocardioides zeae]